MENFLSRITEKKSLLPQIAEEIKESGLPLVLYGAGLYAKVIYTSLSKYGVEVADVAVTSVKKNPPKFMGHKIQSISKAIGKYEKCNVIIGYHATTTIETMRGDEKKLVSSGRVEKVYYYDAVHSIYHNELNLEYSFVERNQHTLDELYKILADDLSRDILTSYVNQRISGDVRYLSKMCSLDHYFPDIINLEDGEVFVDCGAFDGDSVEMFINNMGSKKIAAIYAFEPDALNFEKLKKRNFANMSAIQIGCYNEKTTLRFSSENNTGSALAEDGECEINVDTIDNVLQGKKATYIKMDIEGAELAAIEGARHTITTHKPKLAISMYHKKEDLITIPQKILSYMPTYKLFLRCESPYAHELVLYAV